MRQALAANRLTAFAVVAVVGTAIAPLTVVAGGATTGWAVAGILAIPLAYLVMGLVLTIFSFPYTAMISRGSSAGPLYTVPARGLGRPAGVGSGLVALAGYLVMHAGLLGGVGAVATPLLKTELGLSAPWWIWALLAWQSIAGFGALSVGWVSKVLGAFLAAEVLVTIVLTVVMFIHPAAGGHHIDLSSISPHLGFVPGFGAACAIAVAGFAGFEGTGNLSEESKNPRRTIPRATAAALIAPIILYTVVSVAMVNAAGPDKIIAKATSDGTDTMFNLAGPYVPHSLIVVGHFLLLSSLYAAAMAFHQLVSRYLFTLGREHPLPSWLARTSSRTNAPIAASLVTSGAAVLIIALYAIEGWDPLTKMFYQLTVLGGFAVLLLILGAGASAFVHFMPSANRGDGVGIGRGIIAPAFAVIALSVVLVETLQQFAVLLGLKPDDPMRWIYPASFGVLFVIGMCHALILRVRRPEVYAAIGTSKPPVDRRAFRKVVGVGV